MLGEANLNLPIISLHTITLLHLSSCLLQPSLNGPTATSFYYFHVAPALHQTCLDSVKACPLSLLRAALWLHTEEEVAVEAVVADMVAAGITMGIDQASVDPGMCMQYAYCPAYVPTDRPIALSSCPHTLPLSRRPPPATFRCAVVQMAYVDLYMHLIQDPADDEVAAALHAEQMAIVRVQAALHCVDARIAAFHPDLAQAAMDRCVPTTGSLCAHYMTTEISTAMHAILMDCPTLIIKPDATVLRPADMTDTSAI